jgi:lyso-ornithine lipid O-acyltransferase
LLAFKNGNFKSRPTNSPSFSKNNETLLKKRFTDEILRHFKIKINSINDQPKIKGPAVFVCNHISYLDIPLLMNQIPAAGFVSKSEVARWPIIGQAAKKLNTVFVKRDSQDSRSNVRQTLIQAFAEEKRQIIVFPSATTKIKKSKMWRKGIFEIAALAQVPVIAVRINYKPLREVAYIDNDNFVKHLFNLVNLKEIDVSVEFAEPRLIKDPLSECSEIKAWCEELMSEDCSIK